METRHETRADRIHAGTKMHSVYMRHNMKLMPAWPRGTMSPDMKLSIYYHIDLVFMSPRYEKIVFT